mgnify:CR=1 FL=1
MIFILSFLSACSSKPHALQHKEDADAVGGKVYIVSHGWHTGLILPTERVENHLPALRKRFGDATYIEFGWGDKEFYQAEEVTLWLTLRTLFWPTESVVHTVPVNMNRYFKNTRFEEVCLGGGEYDSLIRFISNSFQKNKEGEILALESGTEGKSQFYRGVGDYYLFNTCNKWTAKGLKSSGLDIVPTFKLTADSIMDYLEGYKQASLMGSEADAAARKHPGGECP